jgi:hypothetical protein
MTIDLAQIMLNEGIEAAQWKLASGGNLGEELALCQRYYETASAFLISVDSSPAYSFATNNGSNPDIGMPSTVFFKQSKRANPTVNILSSSLRWYGPSNSAPQIQATSTEVFKFGTFTDYTQSRGWTANIVWAADAEL